MIVIFASLLILLKSNYNHQLYNYEIINAQLSQRNHELEIHTFQLETFFLTSEYNENLTNNNYKCNSPESLSDFSHSNIIENNLSESGFFILSFCFNDNSYIVVGGDIKQDDMSQRTIIKLFDFTNNQITEIADLWDELVYAKFKLLKWDDNNNIIFSLLDTHRSRVITYQKTNNYPKAVIIEYCNFDLFPGPKFETIFNFISCKRFKDDVKSLFIDPLDLNPSTTTFK